MFRSVLGATTSALILLACSGLSARAADSVGDVSRQKEDASARLESVRRALHPDAPVYMGETLTTGRDARLEVILGDGATLTLGENAAMLLDELVVTPETSSGTLSLFTGVFRLASDSARHKDLTITTPVATIGIRGTDVWGGTIDGGLGILLLDGEVTVTNNAGTVTLDEPGEGTTVLSADVAPAAVRLWPEAKAARAFATVSFE